MLLKTGLNIVLLSTFFIMRIVNNPEQYGQQNTVQVYWTAGSYYFAF